MNTDLTVYVDEFGSDILAPLPSDPFGVGFFACRDEDINALNEKLTREIPQKIHLKECKTLEELRNMVKKVSCFLADCEKKIHGGSVMFSKPEFFEIAEEHSNSSEKVENWGLGHLVGETPKIVSTSVGLAYSHCSDIQIRFIFEEMGNHQDYKKRMKKIEEGVWKGFKSYFQKFYRLLEPVNNIPKISICLDYCESKHNIKLAQLADVFAHIGKRACRSDDHFSMELYGLMKDHFNLFDRLPKKESIRAKGVFDVHKTMTKEMVIEKVSRLKR